MKQIIFTASLIFAFCFVAFAIEPFDSYAKISWEEERMKLDNLAIVLYQDKNLIARLSFEVDEKTSERKIIKRLNNIYSYLTNKRRVDKNRISFDISKKNKEYTTYFVMKSGLQPLSCENCSVIEGRKFGQKIKKTISEKIKNYDSANDTTNNRRTFHKHYPNLVARRGAEGEFRASGAAFGDGSGGLCFVDAIFAAQSEKSALV